MTTILKAVQELERRDHRFRGQKPEARNERDGRLRWAMIGAVLITLAGAAIGGAFLIRERLAPPVVPAQRTSTVRQPPIAPRETIQQQAAPRQPFPAAQVAPSASDNQPQGRVERARPVAPPRTAALAPPKGQAAPRQAALPREPSAPTMAPQDSAVPGLQVQSVNYSQVGGQSTATLQTAGARRVTLHEGESADGIEVQLIRPNAVYLRQGGNVFVVNVAP